MTPKQLRYFTTIIRLGGVSRAAAELGVSQAAVSASIAGLRRELGDPLFHASRNGLVTTGGGQRLAHRAEEILGLQEQTAREVAGAADDRRLLRIASTCLFTEYGGPGLLDVVANDLRDVDVEIVTESSDRFSEALLSGRAELAIGPRRSTVAQNQLATEFLGCEIISVAAPETAAHWKSATWFVGPSVIEPGGVCQFIIGRARIPRQQQRLCSSHSASVETARNGHGVALVPAFAVRDTLATGTLVKPDDARLHAAVTWTAYAISDRLTSAARDVIELLQTPAASQAMRAGAGIAIENAESQLERTASQ